MAEQIKEILDELLKKHQESDFTGEEYRLLMKDMNKAMTNIRSQYYKNKSESIVHDPVSMSSLSDLYKDNMQMLVDADKRKKLKPIQTHYPVLDKLTGGFFEGEVIVIGGRPCHGKTTMALNLAQRFASLEKINVAYFSLEQSAEYMYCRLLQQFVPIPFYKLYSGQLNDTELLELQKVNETISKLPVFFNSQAISSFEHLEMALQDAVATGCKVVIIDYLQLMKSNFHFHNREYELSHIMRRIKQMAGELKVPIILFSQLNRQVETRTSSRRPQLCDLRDSGEIEQVADKVFFLTRPELYGIEIDENGNTTKNMIELIIAKNKTGNMSDVQLRIDKQTGIITESEYQEASFDDFVFTKDSGRLGELEDKPF